MNWQHEVLDIVGGRSLESGIPTLIQDQIRESYNDVKLDHLLTHTNDRASLIVLISLLPTLDDDESVKVLVTLLEELKLPSLEWIWWIDEYTMTKNEYRIQMDFKQHSKNKLVVIRELLNIRKNLRQKFKLDILQNVGIYYTESPWCDLESVEISKEIVSKLKIDKDEDLIYELVKILQLKFSTLKQTKVSQAGYRKLSLNNGLKPKLGFSEVEDQRFRWKTENIDSISLFTMFLSIIPTDGNQLKDYWWIISPTILNILDDHEGPIKLKGVELLSLLLPKIDDGFLRLTGLIDIFYDAIAPLLSYLPKLTPTKQSVLIQEKTYIVLIELFSKTPDDFKDKLIILLNSGIYQSINTVRDNFEILIVLIGHINRIVGLLGITTVKCLPRLLYTIGMIISDPFIYLHQELFEEVLECLIVTILNGWPRIENHKYDILGMIIMAFKKDEKSSDVGKKLKVLVQILKKVCVDKDIENDIYELMKSDESLKELFE